ncbi:hypothetical protein PAV_1c00730 [Paenibacillus alvei DSM 29]|nr:hypothetical protein PAV_1c00730 [Paenibacillus alvei DSM 29]
MEHSYGQYRTVICHIYKSINIDIIKRMDPLLICKALSNDTRLNILQWLKHPEEHFDEEKYIQYGISFATGVCVGDIQKKTGLAQSVISSYLLSMQQAGLLESERVGKWTYYRRNEQTIREYAEYVTHHL